MTYIFNSLPDLSIAQANYSTIAVRLNRKSNRLCQRESCSQIAIRSYDPLEVVLTRAGDLRKPVTMLGLIYIERLLSTTINI